MLRPPAIPTLFITATDTGIGKTVIAGAIAHHFHTRHRARVAVLKPAATGCVHRREGLVSEDAEFLAHCADARFPLDLICPNRYAEPLAPAVAASRANIPLDWTAIQYSIDTMSQSADILIIEGVGGVLVPLDDHHTVLDFARWLSAPAVVVARPALGTINHTLLTLRALRSENVPIAGVVINRYPPDTTTIAEETNPPVIHRWGKTPILAIVPETSTPMPPLPPEITSPIDSVDWPSLAAPGRD